MTPQMQGSYCHSRKRRMSAPGTSRLARDTLEIVGEAAASLSRSGACCSPCGKPNALAVRVPVRQMRYAVRATPCPWHMVSLEGGSRHPTRNATPPNRFQQRGTDPPPNTSPLREATPASSGWCSLCVSHVTRSASIRLTEHPRRPGEHRADARAHEGRQPSSRPAAMEKPRRTMPQLGTSAPTAIPRSLLGCLEPARCDGIGWRAPARDGRPPGWCAPPVPPQDRWSWSLDHA